MLQIIRNVFSGPIAIGIIVLLIIPFAFFGIDSYFSNATNIDAARVNDMNITLAEYQSSFQNVRRQVQEFSPDMVNQNDFIKQQTLDGLIERILLSEVQDDLGLRVSGDQVRATIFKIPALNNPEGFDSVMYQNFLAIRGYTASMFEAELHQDLTLEQLQTGLLATTIVTPDELNRIVAFEKQTRDIQFATISYDTYRDGITVSSDEVETYYAENTNDFTSPEQVKLSYILLSIDNIAQELGVKDEDIRAYFDNFRDNYSIAERRKVRQILVYAESDENKDKAATIAEEIYQLVANSNSEFDDVRDKYNDDEITVEISDFGFLNEGVLDPEIDEVVFSAEPGVLSQPILSDYGYQIVVVDEVTGGDRPEFEEVSTEVETDYRRELAEKQFFELYDELAVLTYENPETLDLASESLGLPVRESSFLTKFGGSDILLNNQKVIEAAFSEQVLDIGNNSKLLELDSDNIIVIRVLEHQLQKILPLTDVRDSIEARMLFEKGTDKTRLIGEEIISKINQNVDLAAIAEEYSIIWVERNSVSRDNTELDRQLTEAVFRAGAPKDGISAVSGVSLLRGDYAVIRVNELHDVELDSLSEEDITPVKNQVRQSRASRSWSNIVAELRAKADIEIYEDNLN